MIPWKWETRFQFANP